MNSDVCVICSGRFCVDGVLLSGGAQGVGNNEFVHVNNCHQIWLKRNFPIECPKCKARDQGIRFIEDRFSACSLCSGTKRLKTEPVPIMQVVDWEPMT